MLAVENVTVRFGGLVALSSVSLHVDEGEIVGLIGTNGAGKSTLMDVVSGFTTADEGTVILVYGWQMKPEKPDEQTIVQTFRWRVQITRINDELKMTNFEWVT